MCLAIKYQCPYCGANSGHESVIGCKQSPCVGQVTRERYMEGHHFVGWHCRNPNCSLSRYARALARLEVRTIVQGQAEGQALPEILQDEDDGNNMMGLDCYVPEGQDEETSPPESSTVATAGSSTADADGPAAGSGPATGPVTESNKVKTTRALAWFRRQVALRNALTGNPHGREPSLFIQDITGPIERRVDTLLQKIIHVTEPLQANRWCAVEDELLQLLRNIENPITHRHIAEWFLPRHTGNGCETRYSNLTKVANQPQQGATTRAQQASTQTQQTATQASQTVPQAHPVATQASPAVGTQVPEAAVTHGNPVATPGQQRIPADHIDPALQGAVAPITPDQRVSSEEEHNDMNMEVGNDPENTA